MSFSKKKLYLLEEKRKEVKRKEQKQQNINQIYCLNNKYEFIIKIIRLKKKL